MRLSLPYSPSLGSLLRQQSRPADRALWMRLDRGRRELFCAWPARSLVVVNQVITEQSGDKALTQSYTGDPWRRAREWLAALPRDTPPEGHPFREGLAGFFGYGPAPDGTGTPFPETYLGHYSAHILIDHVRQTVDLALPPGLALEQTPWAAVVDFVKHSTLPADPPAPFRLTRPFQGLTSPARYREDFARIQAYLRQGDCYQVNYAQAFRATCTGSSADAMDRLLAETDPAHAAWISLPEGDVLSLSPELFLRVDAGHVTTCPIKGTAPRSADPATDLALRDGLAASAKNRAENLMIVDLLRHDIGQHAETGSVHVERLFEVETLPQVHHLVSTVTCTLKEDSHVLDLIRDAFPGGSITGAPKKRAMEIIAELEPTPRGPYCGSIGYIGAHGDAQLNIAIRTLLRRGDEILAWAGGGIVADSECEAEYEECFHKIGALMRALETMGR